MNAVWGGVTLTSKVKHYHCMNNACGFYIDALKKKKPKHKLRWKILTAYLGPDSFVERTYCPHCKWELKLGLDEQKEVDEKPVSALDLLKAIAQSPVSRNAEP